MQTVHIDAKTLADYIQAIDKLDPDTHKLFVHRTPEGIEGCTFMYEGHQFTVTSTDLENNEEPLLFALRSDCLAYEDDVTGLSDTGYYTLDERPIDAFGTGFRSHTDWTFSSGACYAQGIPGVKDGTLIGFYWLPLSGIASDLQPILETEAV